MSQGGFTLYNGPDLPADTSGYLAQNPRRPRGPGFFDPWYGPARSLSGQIMRGYAQAQRAVGAVNNLIARGGAAAAGAAARLQGWWQDGSAADLGRKLEYLFGNATGSAHNISRSLGMLRQLNSVGISDTAINRAYVAHELEVTLSDPSTIVRIQENGRVLRESLLMGPNGALKMQSVWEDTKLITVELFGGHP